MKLSIEAKVASVIAAGFLAVTVGVVAQANGAAAAGGPDNYGLTSNPGVNTYVIRQEYDGSIVNRTSPVRLSLGKNVDGARPITPPSRIHRR